MYCRLADLYQKMGNCGHDFLPLMSDYKLQLSLYYEAA